MEFAQIGARSIWRVIKWRYETKLYWLNHKFILTFVPEIHQKVSAFVVAFLSLFLAITISIDHFQYFRTARRNTVCTMKYMCKSFSFFSARNFLISIFSNLWCSIFACSRVKVYPHGVWFSKIITLALITRPVRTQNSLFYTIGWVQISWNVDHTADTIKFVKTSKKWKKTHAECECEGAWYRSERKEPQWLLLLLKFSKWN